MDFNGLSDFRKALFAGIVATDRTEEIKYGTMVTAG